MWRPYLKVIAKKVPHAVHILDRFHIVARLNKVLDEVRATEAKRLAQGLVPIPVIRLRCATDRLM